MSGSGARGDTRAGASAEVKAEAEAGAAARVGEDEDGAERGARPDDGGLSAGTGVPEGEARDDRAVPEGGAAERAVPDDGSAAHGAVTSGAPSGGAASEGPAPHRPGAVLSGADGGALAGTGAGPGEGSHAGPRPDLVRGRRWRAVRDAAHRNVLRSPGAVLSILVLLLVLGWALAPKWFTQQSPTTGIPADRFRPPSGAHPFGTDQLGRDVYARVVHGASLSLRATVVAIALALVIGTLLGLASGFFGRWADAVIMRLVEVMLSVPPVLLSLTIVAAIGFGTVQVAVAVGVTSVAGFARVMRAEVLRVRTAGYVEATILLGSRWWRVLFRYVLPAAVGPVLALAALDFGLVVLAIAGLSFLGYGEPPPAPEWGALVADGRNYLATAWWLTTLPSVVVSVVVLAANRLSRILETRGERR